MYCRLRYRHPVTFNSYYFVKFRNDEGDFRPVGCLSCRKDRSMLFKTKREAREVAVKLKSLGYRSYLEFTRI